MNLIPKIFFITTATSLLSIFINNKVITFQSSQFIKFSFATFAYLLFHHIVLRTILRYLRSHGFNSKSILFFGSKKAYQYLLNAIQRDGVPYDLISKSLPTVEGAVNDILAQIVDFSVVFSMNGKDIDTHIVYDDDRVWSLELSSGMERFISSLAIRIGLMNVSNLPQGNFLAIDEGWGTMDSDNLNSVAQLFQYLKSQFQFTFVVSHIETMRDFVDTLLEIKKIDGSSSVRFSR